MVVTVDVPTVTARVVPAAVTVVVVVGAVYVLLKHLHAVVTDVAARLYPELEAREAKLVAVTARSSGCWSRRCFFLFLLLALDTTVVVVAGPVAVFVMVTIMETVLQGYQVSISFFVSHWIGREKKRRKRNLTWWPWPSRWPWAS